MKIENIKTKGPYMTKERRIAFSNLMSFFVKTEIGEALRLKVLDELRLKNIIINSHGSLK